MAKRMVFGGNPKNLCLLAAVFLLAGCSRAPAPAEDVTPDYRRLISLGPTITQNIFLLGQEHRLAAVSRYCAMLEEVSGKEVAGDLVSLNMERALRIGPDLIIATDLLRPSAVERAEALGMKVMVFPEPEGFGQMCSHFMELGRLLGVEEKAAAILDDVLAKVEELKREAAGEPSLKVLVQIGSRPLWVSPRNSFINDIIEFAGGVNAGPAGGGMVSIEEVLRVNPDVIIIVDMGIGREQADMWRNYPALGAVRDGRIHLVDSFTYCSPTPVVFTKALEETISILRGHHE